jgi:release factor glutamine methyltransferase
MTGSAPHEQSHWTTRRLLAWTTDHFTKKGVDSPRLSAEMLLAHVLGVKRLKLYMDPDRPASDLERAALRELVERASRQEPVDYLVGHAPFFSMMLKVTPAVLIPRPSTETLVEHVIQHSRRTPGFHRPLLADVGTGSGAIAIAIAKHIPDCRVIATDQSADALAIAQHNAREQGVLDRIEFHQGNLLEPLRGQRVRYLLSNPPYISDAEWQAVQPNVKDYEPTAALRAGADGLDCLRPLIARGTTVLDQPGQLVLEIADSQKQAVLDLAQANPALSNAHILADHEALPRVLVADHL